MNEELTGRTIVIIEDIVDTGHTMSQMLRSLDTRHPDAVYICTLFVEPDKLEVPLILIMLLSVSLMISFWVTDLTMTIKGGD